MIDLYFWPTGNGKKVVILLEELGLPYTFKPINIGRGDQLDPGVPEDLAQWPHAGDRRRRTDGRRRADLDLRVRRDHDVPGGEGRESSVRTDPRGKYEVAQWMFWQMANQGPKLGEQGHFRRAPGQRQERRPHLCPAAASTMRRTASSACMNLGLFNKQLSRRRRIHDRRHDLLSVGVELGHARHRHRGIPQREALAGRDRRAAGGARRRWRWDRSSARTRPRSAPRSRPAGRSWSRTSGRRRFPRNG